MDIFLPCEIKSRELDSRVLLSSQLLNLGFTVILGHKNRVNEIALSRFCGIYLSKSCALIDSSLFDELKKRNHLILALDEEAIIHQNIEAHVRSRLSEKSLQNLAKYLAWGNYDASVVRKYFPSYKNIVTISGNPRIDLLSQGLRDFYSSAATALRDEYGDFVMIPSSFGMCNHFQENGPRISWRRQLGMIKTDEDVVFYTEYYQHFRNIFDDFWRDIKLLSRIHPNTNFIVRPHPSENQEVLAALFDGITNIKVVYEGSVVPWLYASKFVIHNGCTTALESYLLDKHVISYRPFVNDKYDLHFPNDISCQVYSFSELASEVSRSLIGNPDMSYRSSSDKLISGYINLPSQSNYAYLSIANSIHLLASSRSSVSLLFYLRGSSRALLYGNILLVKHFLRSILRFFDLTSPRKSQLPSYIQQKFPSLNIGELRQRFFLLSKVISCDSKAIDISSIHSNVFEISRSQ